MEQIPHRIMMGKYKGITGHPEVGESVNILTVGHLPIGLELAGAGSASA